VDISARPVTETERHFVELLITHVHSAYELLEVDLVLRPGNLEKDIAAFFTLPIPKSVWESVKSVHDEGFVRFVQSCVDAW
jgi:hypothetical protein